MSQNDGTKCSVEQVLTYLRGECVCCVALRWLLHCCNEVPEHLDKIRFNSSPFKISRYFDCSIRTYSLYPRTNIFEDANVKRLTDPDN